MMKGGDLITLCVLAAACSTSNGTSDAGDDGGVVAFKCGAGGTAGSLRVTDAVTLAPIVGAVATASGCTTTTSDDSGNMQLDLQQGLLVKAHVTATGYIDEHVEATPQAAGFYKGLDLVPIGLKDSLFTGWTSGQGYIIAGISPSASDAGTCSTVDGLVASVKGHPEIQIGYLTSASVRSATLTATDSFGVVVAGPMPPGNYELDASSTTCTAGVDNGIYFHWPQSTDVEADAVSTLSLKLQ